MPIFFLGTPFSLSALDLVEKKGCASCSSTLFVAFQEEASSVLTILRLNPESFEVLGELRASLPEGALLGDIQRGEGGFLLGVFYPQGAINLLWLSDSGELEIPAEPTEAPEGHKIFRLSRSGIFITNPSPGLVTLATYDKEGEPIVLDLKPCGFDGVKIRSFSSYPKQADSFALSVGPHQGLFGVSSWEGVVVFDSSGQEILGLGENENQACCCPIVVDWRLTPIGPTKRDRTLYHGGIQISVEIYVPEYCPNGGKVGFIQIATCWELIHDWYKCGNTPFVCISFDMYNCWGDCISDIAPPEQGGGPCPWYNGVKDARPGSLVKLSMIDTPSSLALSEPYPENPDFVVYNEAELAASLVTYLVYLCPDGSRVLLRSWHWEILQSWSFDEKTGCSDSKPQMSGFTPDITDPVSYWSQDEYCSGDVQCITCPVILSDLILNPESGCWQECP